MQSGGGRAEQVGTLGVKHFAAVILQAGFCHLKLALGEEMGREARFRGGRFDLGFVSIRQEVLKNADITAHGFF